MARLEWRDEYRFGNAAVDAEHRALIRLINGLVRDIEGGCGRDRVLAALDQIHITGIGILLVTNIRPDWPEDNGQVAEIQPHGPLSIRKTGGFCSDISQFRPNPYDEDWFWSQSGSLVYQLFIDGDPGWMRCAMVLGS